MEILPKISSICSIYLKITALLNTRYFLSSWCPDVSAVNICTQEGRAWKQKPNVWHGGGRRACSLILNTFVNRNGPTSTSTASVFYRFELFTSQSCSEFSWMRRNICTLAGIGHDMDKSRVMLTKECNKNFKYKISQCLKWFEWFCFIKNLHNKIHHSLFTYDSKPAVGCLSVWCAVAFFHND